MARKTEREKAESQGCGPEIARLIKWFLDTSPPPEPFILYQGVRVSRPLGFWQALKSDIATGPGKARAFTGAFQEDLRQLAKLLGASPAAQQEKPNHDQPR